MFGQRSGNSTVKQVSWHEWPVAWWIRAILNFTGSTKKNTKNRNTMTYKHCAPGQNKGKTTLGLISFTITAPLGIRSYLPISFGNLPSRPLFFGWPKYAGTAKRKLSGAGVSTSTGGTGVDSFLKRWLVEKAVLLTTKSLQQLLFSCRIHSLTMSN